MKLGPLEIESPEIEAAAKAFNSRIGLAVIVWLMLTFGLGPKIDAVLDRLGALGERQAVMATLLDRCVGHGGERTARR